MRFIALLGLAVFLLLPWLLSENRSSIKYRPIFWGMALQLIFALLVLGIPAFGIPGLFSGVFSWINDLVIAILNYTAEGSEFLFGSLMNTKSFGFIFAVQVLPTILFFSTLTTIAYHLGIMQRVVQFFAKIMQKAMKTSGAETLSVAANIFVGQTEAPLTVKPFIERMTRSELMVVMVGGMATVAGGVLAAYVGFLKDKIPDIAGHLVTASVMSAPAALAISKLMVPETSTPETTGSVDVHSEEKDTNVIEAAARGASEGLKLALNVGAMLLVFIALIALVNGCLGWFGGIIGFDTWGKDFVPQALGGAQQDAALSLELIFGWIFAPIAFLMGIPWSEAPIIGAFLGQKIVLNEFVAFLNLSNVKDLLSERTLIIASYALCGFANFSSIGIQLGGIGGIAPSRRSELAELGLKSVIGGSLAAFMTAAIAGLLI